MEATILYLVNRVGSAVEYKRYREFEDAWGGKFLSIDRPRGFLLAWNMYARKVFCMSTLDVNLSLWFRLI